MKRFPLFVLLVLNGCAHEIRHLGVHNGIVKQRVEGEIGWFSSDIRVETQSQAYPDCVAGIGNMPGGEEEDLCVYQTRRDVIRRGQVLDSYLWWGYPYGGYYP